MLSNMKLYSRKCTDAKLKLSYSKEGDLMQHAAQFAATAQILFLIYDATLTQRHFSCALGLFVRHVCVRSCG